MITIRGKKVLISLGGTFEPIDSVRGITNKSSGKMGLALAKQAYILGADVTLVVANVSVEISPLFNVIPVETSKQMAKAIFEIVKDFDIFISTAAVSDFEVVERKSRKIDSDSSLAINLKPTVKIIRQIKKINPSIFLVGFKAEFNISREDIIYCAHKQINDAGTDLVVANDVSRKDCNFGSDKNEVLIIDDEVMTVPLASKDEIAKTIMEVISKKTTCR
ncbi:phosphopantothenoylcysteine decarboxylase domain-containing protein [Methanobrevibacter millerae]|uniref:Phosphopantothenoylcysteine decarboxylase / phosphopantothenate--cysteine ligase n=1 Tax=Methanobrevibacter millerae TaxID=230361 RepID=A0A1G5XHQ2_9EURY|nr:phosphopantothenoylcysteine decarboxylase [Methanobrevibacter millerae]SDA69227.1 phosphopantothenoylcysteine decarboxylase / phosphopantothenate--cysteine ligase [Methanobrevibacter millerae]